MVKILIIIALVAVICTCFVLRCGSVPTPTHPTSHIQETETDIEPIGDDATEKQVTTEIKSEPAAESEVPREIAEPEFVATGPKNTEPVDTKPDEETNIVNGGNLTELG